jgi:hypothetical protein
MMDNSKRQWNRIDIRSPLDDNRVTVVHKENACL